MLLDSCVLLAALFAAPALSQCPYNTTTSTASPTTTDCPTTSPPTTACPTTSPPTTCPTTTTTAASPPENCNYTITYVDVLFAEFLVNFSCDPQVQLIEEVFTDVFIYTYEDSASFFQTISINSFYYRNKALAVSDTEGLSVNVVITPSNKVIVIFEIERVFIQVTITSQQVVIIISYTTIDSCSCAPVTYESTAVYSLVPPPADYDYDGGASNCTTQRVCSDCGDNTPPTCNVTSTTPPCDSTDDEYDYYPDPDAPEYPPPSGGCGCGCDS